MILSYGPYAKGLAFQEGYPNQWERMVSQHPDVEAGSSNRYQNWEVVDPEKWVPDGYVLRARGLARRRRSPASPRLLLKNTIVRSSRLAPSSFVSLQLREEVAQGLHLLHLELLELLDLARVLAVVRQVVMAERHARDRRHAARAQQHAA